MKKSYWAILALMLTTATLSCKKSDNNSEPTNYKVDGIHDVTIAPDNGLLWDYALDLAIDYTSNIKENVTLSLEGLPPGCTANIATPSGNPPFGTQVTFRDVNAAPGNYPIKLICQGSRTGMRSYTFNMVASAESDYTPAFTGTYPNSSSPFGVVYTISVTAGEKMNKIYLYNFDNAGNTLYAFVKSSGEMDIPQQIVNNVSYSGRGQLLGFGSQLFVEKSDTSGTYTFSIEVYK